MQQQRVQDAMTFMFGLEPIVFWGWLFFLLYMGLMLSFGFVGMGRVHSSDDFATARAGYGPVFLALAMTATAWGYPRWGNYCIPLVSTSVSG